MERQRGLFVLNLRSGIRGKLIAGFALAVLVQAFITTLVGLRLFYDRMIDEAQNEVRAALNVAREIYSNRLREIQDTVRLTATRSLVIDAVARSDRAVLAGELDRIRRDEDLDILTVTDAEGRVICRARSPEQDDSGESGLSVVLHVLSEREPIAGTQIVSREELWKEHPDLAARAYIEFIETPRAKPRPETFEEDGMVKLAAAPVFDRKGQRLLGVLYGGRLLNRNYTIVDNIRETAFEREFYRGRPTGTATIFQNDLRISTNVRNDDGSRAIGTRVSQEVAEKVLDKGRQWVDQAFVVNEWYITAYEPIRNLSGEIIGILYVGVLKRPYTDELWKTLSIFFGIALLGIALVILIAVLLAETLTRPLRDMERLARRVADGEYDVEIDVKSGDEIGRLAASFNTMTKTLSSVHGELRDWARTLEEKVERRTEEIKAMQNQLMQSEKLASLGKLAAGVAHEINNPMTGILTNASLLLEDLPEDDPMRADLQTIVDETIRCRRIVKGLLDFARQSRPEKKPVAVNEILHTSLALLRNQASFRNIDIHENLDPYLPRISADPNQLQQVFVNILINASEAMPEGGRIEMITRRADKAGDSVEIAFVDTGPGIPDETLSKLFDPFFTTKATGTGLGLAVSYGIVESHGGKIEVKNNPEQGATFTIQLPTAES